MEHSTQEERKPDKERAIAPGNPVRVDGATDSEEFGTRVAELKKTFQMHVRDEKKELLPAIVKALSDDEAAAVVERIQEKKNMVEAAQRAEADERRTKAKHFNAANAAKTRAKAKVERARKDTVLADAEAVAAKTRDENEHSEARRRPEGGRGIAEAADQAAESGAQVARQGLRWIAQDGSAGIGEAISREARDAVRETTAAGLSMVELLNEQAQHAMQATLAVGRARTMTEVPKAQSDFIAGSFQRMEQLMASVLRPSSLR